MTTKQLRRAETGSLGLKKAAKQGVASDIRGGYSESVVTLLTNGFRSLKTTRRIGAHNLIVGAFFVPAMPCYGSRAWETERSAGFRVSRSANPRTAATHNRFAAVRGSSDNTHGASPMNTLNPSALHERAAAHRAMALSALRANSSLSVRLRRYNQHMERARAIEAEIRHQQTTRTSDPRTALAWVQSGRSVRIAALNLRDHQQHAEALAAVEAQGVDHA